LGEMLRLPRIVGVDDPIRVKLVCTKSNRGKVRCAIKISAVGLSNNQGRFVGTVDEDDYGTIGLSGNVFITQLFYYNRKKGIVKGFAPFVSHSQFNSESFI
jgi:hypothetical protein